MVKAKLLGLAIPQKKQSIPDCFINFIKKFNFYYAHDWYDKDIYSWKMDENNIPPGLINLADKHKLEIISLTESQCKTPKLLLADMDMTLVTCETLDEVANYAGYKDKVTKITDDAMEGKIDFQESLDLRMALLNGQSVDLFSEVAENITISSGAENYINALQGKGCKCVIVSGGFLPVANTVAKRLGIDTVYANILQQKDNKVNHKPNTEFVIDAEEKAKILTALSKKHGLKQEETMAIGDGANDLDMIQQAGTGISYHGKHVLEKIADIRIKYNDFSVLNRLPFLNYK